MALYRATEAFPPLVRSALALAERHRFTHSSTVEVGRLLSVLAAHCRGGTIGEIGTGCGVGTAWMVSGMGAGSQLISVEHDPLRAEDAAALFAHLPNVRVLQADWTTLLAHGPFDLLFADGGKAKAQQPDTLLTALRVGGIIVLDDLTPEEYWPPEWHGQPDPVRDFWLNDPRLVATEIRTTPRAAVIVATRVEGADGEPG